MSTAAKLAASYFNYGASLYYRLMELAGCPGGANTLGICNSLDDEQEYFAARKNDEAVKAERSKERKSEKRRSRRIRQKKENNTTQESLAETSMTRRRRHENERLSVQKWKKKTMIPNTTVRPCKEEDRVELLCHQDE